MHAIQALVLFSLLSHPLLDIYDYLEPSMLTIPLLYYLQLCQEF
jgi:hypothetical protein